MYFDANGNPDPNGPYQKINGKLCLRPGGRAHFDLAFRDGATVTFLNDAKSSEPASITDAELAAFAASREGQGIQSLVLKQHQDATRYLGDSAPPLMPVDINRALYDALAAKKRNAGLYQDMSRDIDRAGKTMRDFASDARYS